MKALTQMNQFTMFVHHWYKKNRRDLPWRKTNDPYKIWISEIILQQTRVNQGQNYYLKFIKDFPTISHLADASEHEVLKRWQGLGYYSRARNLHFTARYIDKELKGKFPDNYNEILQLKGIGPYTASAIASISFGLPCPAIDGNVYRVLSRYFGIADSPATARGKKNFSELAFMLIPNDSPGFHNQAIMEFGALQCVPQSPNCDICPLAASCYAFSKKMIDQFPVKTKRTKQRNRYFYYFLIENNRCIWLEKRSDNDIWKNLYQLPLVETEKKISEINLEGIIPSYLTNCKPEIRHISSPQRHLLSHQIIFAQLIQLATNKKCFIPPPLIEVDKKNISDFAVPRLIEKLLEKSGYL